MTHASALDPINYTAIKAKQQTVWGAGDYGRIGITLQITGELLCEAMDLRAGTTVLDVAGGNGNVSIAAARRFCRVISTDYVQALLDQSASRAHAEGLTVDYQKADAEALPFDDKTFDNVVSTFGVMFTPNQQQASSELLRVCKRDGKIGMANWTPDGFIGQLLKTVSRYVPPPAGVDSPLAWGTKAFIDQHFAAEATHINVQARDFVFRYESPAHWLDVFATYYGPTLKAFETLDPQEGQALRHDILDLIGSFNRADDGSMVVPSSYVEVVVST